MAMTSTERSRLCRARKRAREFQRDERPEVCDLCGKRKKHIHRDHGHVTGEFRGWLCIGCNTSLGGLGDNVKGLLRAVAYLTGCLEGL